MRMLGRYEHNSDPRLAMLLHEVTEQGWGNDSVGDLDEDGFHASLLIVEPAERQELTEAFDRDIPAGDWILTGDQQGLVTMDQYPTAHAARCAFDHLPDSGGPGERTAHHPGWAARQRYALRLDLGYGPDGNRQTSVQTSTDRYWILGAWIFR